MTTGLELADWMYSICNGRPYAADGGRFGTTPHGLPGEHFDCSGGVSRALWDKGLHDFPTISATQAMACRDAGLLISFEQARETPGALHFWGANHGYDGYGPSGHVAMTYRSNRSIECRGRSWGCGSWPLDNRGSVNWGLVPGINYGHGDPTPTPKRRSKHVIFVIIDGNKEQYQYVGGPATDRHSYIRLYGSEALVNHDKGSPVVRLTRAEFQSYVNGMPLDALGARGWTF